MGLFGFGKGRKKHKKDDNGDVGNFSSFVLLSEPEWDKSQFIQDFKAEWGIDVSDEEADNEEYKDIIMHEYNGMKLVISFIPGINSSDEAEQLAAMNYMWKEAVTVVGKRQAQILVALLGDKDNLIQAAMLFSKAVTTCLNQKHVLAVWGDGAMYQPEYYRAFSDMMKEDGLPVQNWVWFGIYRDDSRSGFYTFGMKKFGKDEMEFYIKNEDVDKIDFNELQEFVCDVAAYVISENVVLRDGETIGFTEWQKLPITKSKGIALDGQTLKIQYK